MRYAALLRGINVGKAKRVAMADLRALVERLGCDDVRTLLNSGNVVFSARRAGAAPLARRIEAALVAELGVASRVVVLSRTELAAVVAGNPLLDVMTNPSRLLVAVYEDAALDARLAPLAAERWAPEALAVGERVAYLWCPPGVLESRLAPAVGKALGDAVTMRNWATMTRLAALMAD